MLWFVLKNLKLCLLQSDINQLPTSINFQLKKYLIMTIFRAENTAEVKYIQQRREYCVNKTAIKNWNKELNSQRGLQGKATVNKYPDQGKNTNFSCQELSDSNPKWSSVIAIFDF